MITIEAIKTEQTRLAEMIAQFEKQTSSFVPCTVTFPDLNKGELWVGAIISADGSKRHHVILLPGEIEKAGWDQSTHSHADRAQLAKAAMRRGHAVNHQLTKSYWKSA